MKADGISHTDNIPVVVHFIPDKMRSRVMPNSPNITHCDLCQGPLFLCLQQGTEVVHRKSTSISDTNVTVYLA